MRICYIANHGCGGADDEGAIRYALERLGHEVLAVPERGNSYRGLAGCDLVLFHKWSVPVNAQRINVPMVFWYFDLVDWPDPTLNVRNRTRLLWMKHIMRFVKIGFCTDGDWVERYNPDCKGKLVWLPQGADERVVGKVRAPIQTTDVLFTGIGSAGGRGRREFVNWMRDNYGSQFKHCERGCYRGALQQEISRAKVLICPDAPATDKYWSNRVYNAAGFGACILHPYCERLAEQYRANEEIVYYTDRENLRSKIDYLIRDDPHVREYREAVGTAALERTRKDHLYRHRCEQLLSVVKERLGVS